MDKLWGGETDKAVNNFPVSGEPIPVAVAHWLGRIKAAIWENGTENGTRHSVTITRLYKTDADPTWKTTTSFNRDDLPLVAKVADMAHTYIFGMGQGEASA